MMGTQRQIHQKSGECGVQPWQLVCEIYGGANNAFSKSAFSAPSTRSADSNEPSYAFIGQVWAPQLLLEAWIQAAPWPCNTVNTESSPCSWHRQCIWCCQHNRMLTHRPDDAGMACCHATNDALHLFNLSLLIGASVHMCTSNMPQCPMLSWHHSINCKHQHTHQQGQCMRWHGGRTAAAAPGVCTNS